MKNKYSLLKVLLVLLVIVFAGVIYSCVSSSKSEGEDVTEVSAEEAAGDRAYTGSEEEEAEPAGPIQISVHVCGAVKEPGVYYIDEGSRVHQAVELAGGFTENAASSYVNLADVVSDGEQIYIPTEEEAEKGELTPPGNIAGSKDTLVNINTADISELTTLAGIGESKAEAIIAYRENVAAFENPEDIINVSGIGESIYDKIKDSIKVK